MRPNAILITTPTGEVKHGNPLAEELLGAVRGRCDTLVCAHTPRGQAVCTAGCAGSLTPGEQQDRGVVMVRGQPVQLVCSEAGGANVVSLVPSETGKLVQLTEREREIMVLVARGFTGERIGGRLGISPATVRTHVQHVRRKLGVRSRSQAVARALALGEIE